VHERSKVRVMPGEHIPTVAHEVIWMGFVHATFLQRVRVKLFTHQTFKR
jgi:hypothetical protein